MLAGDLDRLAAGPLAATRLLGPFDLFLQARDRSLVVGDPAHAKALWPVLGRPGAVLVDGEIIGSWRPRQAGARLRLQVEPWTAIPARVERSIADQAQRLAAYRGVRLSGIDLAG